MVKFWRFAFSFETIQFFFLSLSDVFACPNQANFVFFVSF